MPCRTIRDLPMETPTSCFVDFDSVVYCCCIFTISILFLISDVAQAGKVNCATNVRSIEAVYMVLVIHHINVIVKHIGEGSFVIKVGGYGILYNSVKTGIFDHGH